VRRSLFWQDLTICWDESSLYELDISQPQPQHQYELHHHPNVLQQRCWASLIIIGPMSAHARAQQLGPFTARNSSTHQQLLGVIRGWQKPWCLQSWLCLWWCWRWSACNRREVEAGDALCPGHDKDTVDTFIVTIKTEILKIYLRMRSVLRQESVRSGPHQLRSLKSHNKNIK